MLTSNGIGVLSQNFKTLEPLKIEKMADPSNESSCNAFFLKKRKTVIR